MAAAAATSEQLGRLHAVMADSEAKLNEKHGTALASRGLNDPVPVRRAQYRDAAVEHVDDVLDAVSIDTVSLVGQSGGGIWALLYAMARPERIRSIVLLGSVPLLPGTWCKRLGRPSFW